MELSGTEKNRSGDDRLLDHFEVVVVHDVEPADWDDALATFLLAYVKQKHAGVSTTDASEDKLPAGEDPNWAFPGTRLLIPSTIAAKISEPIGRGNAQSALTTMQP